MWSEIVVQGNYNGPRFTEISLQNDIMQNQENMHTSEISEFSADERREAAIAYFKQGCNCTQAVLAAYSDRIGIDFTTAMKLGASFGGGMGRLREVCGAVSGMFAVIGLMQGYSVPGDIEGKKKHYALIQELAGKFKDIHGSIVCRELLGLGKGPDSPVPEARTGEYYKKRPCAEIIGDAAYIISNYVDNQTSEN